MLGDHMDLLAARDYQTLLRRARLEEHELKAVMRLIQTLNPRPGSSRRASEEVEYVAPTSSYAGQAALDRGAQRRVDAAAAHQRRLRGARASRGLLGRQPVPRRTICRNARWFLKSVQSRNETLLKVATCIVEHQRGFLDYGPEAMKPLVLADIADAIGMHESTISRVTTRKYMHTPRGIFELKYFFSSHVGTASGGEVSSTAIRALIRKLTDDEASSQAAVRFEDRAAARGSGHQGRATDDREVPGVDGDTAIEREKRLV